MRSDSSKICWLVRDTKSSVVFKRKGGYYKLFQCNFINFNWTIMHILRHFIIPLFKEYLFSTYYMPSTILNTGYRDTVLALMKIIVKFQNEIIFLSKFLNSGNYFTAHTNIYNLKYSSTLNICLNQM